MPRGQEEEEEDLFVFNDTRLLSLRMPRGQEALAHGTCGGQRVVVFPAVKQPAALSMEIPIRNSQKSAF